MDCQALNQMHEGRRKIPYCCQAVLALGGTDARKSRESVLRSHYFPKNNTSPQLYKFTISTPLQFHSDAHEVVFLLVLLRVVVEAFICCCYFLSVQIPPLITYALFVVGAAKSKYWRRWRNTWKWWMPV